MEDLKGKINEVIDKVKNDPEFMKKFEANPVPAVEELLGVDLPDDQINGIIDTVKSKLTLDNAGDLIGKIKGLF